MSTERRYVNPKTGEVIDDPEIRPFNQILAELGEGSTVVELSQAMWDLLQRVQDTGKAGTLTLVLKVETKEPGTVAVTDEIRVKMPERYRPTTPFYVDRQGNPSRSNPEQAALPGVTSITVRSVG